MPDPAHLRAQAARARELADAKNKAGRVKNGRPHLLRLAEEFEAQAEQIETAANKPTARER